MQKHRWLTALIIISSPLAMQAQPRQGSLPVDSLQSESYYPSPIQFVSAFDTALQDYPLVITREKLPERHIAVEVGGRTMLQPTGGETITYLRFTGTRQGIKLSDDHVLNAYYQRYADVWRGVKRYETFCDITKAGTYVAGLGILLSLLAPKPSTALQMSGGILIGGITTSFSGILLSRLQYRRNLTKYNRAILMK